MRKMAVEVFALAVVLGMVCVGHGQPAPTDKPKDDKTKKAPQKSKLEEMLEQALAQTGRLARRWRTEEVVAKVVIAHGASCRR